MINYHCGKHDKIYSEDNPCFGCVNEALAANAVKDSLPSAADLDAAAEEEKVSEETEKPGIIARLFGAE